MPHYSLAKSSNLAGMLPEILSSGLPDILKIIFVTIKQSI
jgi:hypothetical protein